MKRLTNLFAALAFISSVACTQGSASALEIPAGSDVAVQKKDGVTVAGRLVEVKPELVVVEGTDGAKTEIPRVQIAEVRAVPPAPPSAIKDDAAAAPSGTKRAAASESSSEASAPAYREVTVPAGTVLPLDLKSSVASDTSSVEDRVTATLRRRVMVGGTEAIPAGSTVIGHVTDAKRSARVKGRARIAFRFTELDLPGDGNRVRISTGTVARQAAATKQKDAAIIGGGAVGGAVIGGLIGGGDGAAKGAAIGGAAGTGTVLATRGKEVRLGPGADIAVKLTAPLTLRVPVRR
jgi:hypothetical protein